VITDKFEAGTVLFTEGIVALNLDQSTIFGCLLKHVTGNWGKVSEEDAKRNNQGIKDGGLLHSAYDINGHTVWIMTEGDRSVTTILLPDEY
jgi:hypothetical protein